LAEKFLETVEKMIFGPPTQGQVSAHGESLERGLLI